MSSGVGGQFQANSYWPFQPLEEDASAVSASSASVTASWVVGVGDFPSPGLWVTVQCRDLWR